MFTKEELEELYVNQELSVKTICEIKNCSTVTVHNYIRKFKIPQRSKDRSLATLKKIESTVGQKYDRWLVLKYLGKLKTNGMLLCLCDCGTVQNIRYYDLINGQTKGCNGCSGILRCKNSENWTFINYENINSTYWGSVRCNARKRDIEFDITTDYAYSLLEQQEFKCKLSNLEIRLPKFNRDKWTATMDRIDSKLGYIKGNIQWLHKDINTMKWAFSQEQFLEYCKLITENNNETKK